MTKSTVYFFCDYALNGQLKPSDAFNSHWFEKVRIIQKKDLDASHQGSFDFGVVFWVQYLPRISGQLTHIVPTLA